MQVTLGEDGSGLSKAQPFFLRVVKKGEAWPGLRRRLREASRDGRAGLRIDLQSFIEEVTVVRK